MTAVQEPGRQAGGAERDWSARRGGGLRAKTEGRAAGGGLGVRLGGGPEGATSRCAVAVNVQPPRGGDRAGGGGRPHSNHGKMPFTLGRERPCEEFKSPQNKDQQSTEPGRPLKR